MEQRNGLEQSIASHNLKALSIVRVYIMDLNYWLKFCWIDLLTINKQRIIKNAITKTNDNHKIGKSLIPCPRVDKYKDSMILKYT